LLLTNDGEFALRLSHPRYEQEKHYEALVRGRPDEATLRVLRTGVVISEDDGSRFKTSPARVRILRSVAGNTWLALTIHEGHKRQVRRMLEAQGHHVLQLRRSGVGPLTLQGIAPGKWRHLTEEELGLLRG
jgi:pseudouridine synthase